jgi:hypothetical protein
LIYFFEIFSIVGVAVRDNFVSSNYSTARRMKLQKSPLFLVALAFAAGICLSAFAASPGFWGLGLMGLATTAGFSLDAASLCHRFGSLLCVFRLDAR